MAGLVGCAAGAELECGEGTVERDGECVADDGATSDPGRPGGLGGGGGGGGGVTGTGTAGTGTGTGSSTGTGSTVPTSGPVLRISPNPLDLGSVDVPCSTTGQITLENIGTEDLVVKDVNYDGGDVLSVEVDGLPDLPLILEPGGTTTVGIEAVVSSDAPAQGRLTVVTNDPRGALQGTQKVQGAYVDTRTEVLTSRGKPKMDVMLLVDNSCSMTTNNQDDLDLGAPLLVERLNAVADWQLIEIIDDPACKVGGILDGSVPNAGELIADFAFSANPIRVLRAEELLAQADKALSLTDPGECNAGFLRPDAHLVILIISDEAEQSGRSGSAWVTDLSQYVDSDELLTISGAVDSNDRCGDNYTAAEGYDVAIAATGGLEVDICPVTWGDLLPDMVPTPASTGAGWVLSEPAIPASLAITVEGVPATEWDYDPVTLELQVFEPEVQPGDEVIVTYAIEADCQP